MRYEDDFGSFWMVDDNEFVKRRHLSRGRPRKYEPSSSPNGDQQHHQQQQSSSSSQPTSSQSQQVSHKYADHQHSSHPLTNVSASGVGHVNNGINHHYFSSAVPTQ